MCAHTRPRAHAPARTRARTHTHTHTRARTRTRAHAHAHAHIRTHERPCPPVPARAYARERGRIRTRARTHGRDVRARSVTRMMRARDSIIRAAGGRWHGSGSPIAAHMSRSSARPVSSDQRAACARPAPAMRGGLSGHKSRKVTFRHLTGSDKNIDTTCNWRIFWFPGRIGPVTARFWALERVQVMATQKVPATAEVIKLDENTVQYFPLSMFTVEQGYNLRMFDPASDADDKLFLGQIIAAGRVNTPVVCRMVDGKIEIVEGHRRYFAACEAEKTGAVRPFPNLPVRGAPAGMTEVARTYDLFVSNSGKPLSPIERAIGVKRLLEQGEKPAAIAAKCGIGKQWVTDLAKMADMPTFLARAVYASNVKSTLAGEMAAESKTKGFDLAELWARASAKARETAKWDDVTGRYVWAVTQKILDPILAEMGATMNKSRLARKPGGETNQTTTKTDAPATTDATKTDAPKTDATKTDAPKTDAPTVATKTGAEMPAPKQGNGTAPVVFYTVAPDGITILDAHKRRILIAEDSGMALAVVTDLTIAARGRGTGLSLRPLTTERPAMTAEQVAAAKGAADRAESSVAKLVPADATTDAPAAPVPAPAKVKGKPGRKPGKVAQAA